jgi:hypothetical protein
MSENALPFDIIAPAAPPPAPPDYTWLIVIGSLLAFALLALAAWHWRRTRQRRLARRDLRHAQQRYAAGSLENHAAAYAIAHALMAGLGTRRIWAPAGCDPDWRALVRQLDALRYGGGEAATGQAAGRLFAEAEGWLKRRGAPC